MDGGELQVMLIRIIRVEAHTVFVNEVENWITVVWALQESSNRFEDPLVVLRHGGGLAGSNF